MNTTKIPRLIAKLAVLLLAASSTALFASTDLTSIPIPTSTASLVKPNVMFTLDNSGSMVWASITGQDATSAYGNNYPDFYSSSVNKIYYDPNVTYTPGVNYDGTSRGNSAVNANTTDVGVTSPDSYLGGTAINIKAQCYGTSLTTPTLALTSTSNCKASSASGYTSLINKYAFYHTYTGSGTPSNSTSYTNNTRVEIKSTTTTYTRSTSRTDCAAAPTCTYAEEIQNFANWYTFYRTRIATMKTVMGRVFSSINNNFRVGFSTINSNGSTTGNTNGNNFINIADFTNGAGGQKQAWYTNLYSISPGGGTPLQDALRRDGEYYKTGSMGYSGGTASVNPVQYSCQQNFAILSTDGFWNSNTVSIPNQDQTVPTLPATVSGLTSGSTWPRPYWEGATSTSNTLSDVAMYYWATDLRTTGTTATNNVPSNTADPATWQHMTTFTVGLGANGSLPYRDDYLTATTGFYHDLVNNVNCSAYTVGCNWPAPVQDTNKAIDDLWHAAVNGHGRYFSAADPTAITTSLSSILNTIAALSSTSSSATLTSTVITGSNNAAYFSNYNTGDWTGEMNVRTIDTTTAQFSSAYSWAQGAQAQLDAMTGNSSDTRMIATFKPTTTAGIPFQWTNLIASQQTQLGAQNVLQFLRGWRCNEVGNTCGSNLYRTRTHLLGDIVNSEAAYVAAPAFNYIDNGYSTFKSTQSSRLATVYVGANDGMLHAFDANATTGGAERWAYLPNLIMGTVKGLSYQINGAPPFTHTFYEDGSPVVGDVDFQNTSGATGGGTDWRTILVSGLNHGGKGFFALDVSSPTANNETGLAGKVLWEFPNPNDATHAAVLANVGYSYGYPIITKANGYGWVVLVTSGYNNGTDTGGTGHGYLYVLNAQTGALLKTIQTTGDSGTAASPSGLAKISAYLTNYASDNTVQRVYGGDLNGDLWRFDLSDATPANWTVIKLAHLADPSGVAQPITTFPYVYDLNTSTHLVYVGTGQYLGVSDVSNTQVQSMYALKDDLTGTGIGNVRPLVGTASTALVVSQTLTKTASTASTTNRPVDFSTQKGWVVDLAVTPGERPTDPTVIYGTLAFTANIPSSDVCSPGGSSWLYYLNLQNGSYSTLADNSQSSGAFIGDVISTRIIGFTVGGNPYGSFRTSAPVNFQPGGQCTGTNCTPTTPPCVGDACNVRTPPGSPSTSVFKVFWREIIN